MLTPDGSIPLVTVKSPAAESCRQRMATIQTSRFPYGKVTLKLNVQNQNKRATSELLEDPPLTPDPAKLGGGKLYKAETIAGGTLIVQQVS